MFVISLYLPPRQGYFPLFASVHLPDIIQVQVCSNIIIHEIKRQEVLCILSICKRVDPDIPKVCYIYLGHPVVQCRLHPSYHCISIFYATELYPSEYFLTTYEPFQSEFQSHPGQNSDQQPRCYSYLFQIRSPKFLKASKHLFLA